jgi:hypothetical protein
MLENMDIAARVGASQFAELFSLTRRETMLQAVKLVRPALENF